MNTPFEFACPICKSRLEAVSPNDLRCATDATTFHCVDGIWRMLRPDRVAYFERFVGEYQTVRQAEGRGSDDAAYYRALPFADRSGRLARDWQIRAASFRALIKDLIAPLEARSRTPLKIIDLGAGNGWLSYRLTQRGHVVSAIDLLTNKLDGLGAHVHYDATFTPIQAEFDHLPLTGNQIDVAIFNSSFHYSVNYAATLVEVWRVMNENGQIVILDSPIYNDAESGRQMVRERQAQFQRAYGFPSDSIDSENFLTFSRLNELAAATQTTWRFVQPSYGWRWTMRPWIARFRDSREPAQFLLAIGTRDAKWAR